MRIINKLEEDLHIRILHEFAVEEGGDRLTEFMEPTIIISKEVD